METVAPITGGRGGRKYVAGKGNIVRRRRAGISNANLTAGNSNAVFRRAVLLLDADTEASIFEEPGAKKTARRDLCGGGSGNWPSYRDDRLNADPLGRFEHQRKV